jgi:hypothetical protein
MATANPTTAIQKKVEVSIKDGKTFSEEVFFLHLESVGNVTSEKKIEVKDGGSFSGAFKQIQFRFNNDRNYIYTKNDNNQKEFDEKYKGTASEFSISGLSAGNANTVIRTGKTNSANDVSQQHNGPAELVTVKVEKADGEAELTLPDDGRTQDKGANKDATTWKPVKMKEDPNSWKVVDDKNINVADQFHSEANAQQYIDFHKSHPNTGDVDVDADVDVDVDGGAGLAVDFNSVIGQGPKLPKENEHHDPKGWREEFGVDQPGPDFQVDYVVEIGADREADGEEVSIQYDGLPHSGGNDRTGDKILFKINKGQIEYLHQIDTDNSQMFEVGKKEGVEPGKDKFEPLQKGKRYGLRVVKRNGADGKSTEHWGYMQNLTDGGPLKEVIHVIDRGQFKEDPPRTNFEKEWRVGVRIDGKNGRDDKMYTKGFICKKI